MNDTIKTLDAEIKRLQNARAACVAVQRRIKLAESGELVSLRAQHEDCHFRNLVERMSGADVPALVRAIEIHLGWP